MFFIIVRNKGLSKAEFLSIKRNLNIIHNYVVEKFFQMS